MHAIKKPGWRLGAALALTLWGLTPAGAQVRDYRVSHQWRAEVDARDRALRVFAAEVEKRVAGVHFTIEANGTSGVKPIEQIDGLLAGKFELTVCPIYFGSNKFPELSIGLLPGVPDNAHTARLLHDSPFETMLQQFAEKNGMHILGWWWLTGGFVSRASEVKGPETVKGLITRGGDPSFDLMLKAAGGSIFVGTSVDFVEGLKGGKIDVGLTSFESLMSFKIYDQTKYATLGGQGIWTTLQPLIIAKSAWDRLTDDEQAIFTEAARHATQSFEADQEKAEAAAIETFKKAGVNVRQLTFDEYAAWLTIARDSSWKTYQALSPDAEALLTAMLTSFIESGDASKKAQ